MRVWGNGLRVEKPRKDEWTVERQEFEMLSKKPETPTQTVGPFIIEDVYGPKQARKPERAQPGEGPSRE